MPAVTVPPRPKGLPTASTQSPIRGLPSENFDQENLDPRIRSNHFRGISLASVGRYFDLVSSIDNVVVGDCISIGRNKESGYLARHSMPALTTGILWHAIRPPEPAKEPLHWRVRTVLGLAVGVGDFLLHRYLDRDHRWLHPLNHVGKARR